LGTFFEIQKEEGIGIEGIPVYLLYNLSNFFI